uniref:Bowman-Birk serine protease inhibitors family domain-containing protein n=1 Tax=Arundo donax TaxID=35708 RepID=A0A0A9D4N8_ARUDO
MKPQALFFAVAVLAVLAAMPLGKGHGGEEGGAGLPEDAAARARLCCNECGACTRSFPPKCTCQDLRPGGCLPACKNCVKIDSGNDGAPLFQCTDFITNFCKHRCTPAAVAA